MAVLRKHNPEVILRRGEGQKRSGYGPPGNEPELVGEACFGLQVASLDQVAHRVRSSSELFLVLRLATPPMDDESCEDRRKQRNDERHGHRVHVLKVLA